MSKKLSLKATCQNWLLLNANIRFSWCLIPGLLSLNHRRLLCHDQNEWTKIRIQCLLKVLENKMIFKQSFKDSLFSFQTTVLSFHQMILPILWSLESSNNLVDDGSRVWRIITDCSQWHGFSQQTFSEIFH